MARQGLLSAHGSLWYDDPRYRLAWFVAPQAIVVVLAVLVLAAASGGDWGKPASSSKERIAELSALRDRAGKDGDAKALEALTRAADDGEIQAAAKLATLYDPLVADSFPRKTVPNDAVRAVRLYGPGADTGDGLAVTRLADLLLDPINPNPDVKRGCALAQAWRDQPALDARGEFRLWLKQAQCLVDDASGLPRDTKRAAEAIFALVGEKYEPAMKTYVRSLGLQKPFVVKALQEHMASLAYGPYLGPVDGIVHPETIARLEMAAGLRPFADSAEAKERRRSRDQEDPRFRYPPGLYENTFRELAVDANTDLKAVARMKAYADAGNVAAMAVYGRCYDPFANRGTVYPPDARVAVAYYERAARGGHRDTAAWAASLYDKGAGALARDPAKAASLMMLQLEVNPSYVESLTDPEIWTGGSGDFWAALQKELAARGFYKNPVEGRRNDATIASLKAFGKAAAR
jgi:TPR repeat protein